MLSFEDRAFITSIKGLVVQYDKNEKLNAKLADIKEVLASKPNFTEEEVEVELQHRNEQCEMVNEDLSCRQIQLESVE